MNAVPSVFFSSLLFKCNLYHLISSEPNSASALCLACKKNGHNKMVKGKTTTNYHLHMKRMHPKEYEEYLKIRAINEPRPIISIDQLNTDNLIDDDDSLPMLQSDTAGRLISSFIFKCNLFQLVSSEATTASALCLVCQQNGQMRYVKGKTTTNYHLHMKRMHKHEYQQYLDVRASGIARPIIPIGTIKIENMDNVEPTNEGAEEYELDFFMHGFFEICQRSSNGCIKANCLTCQRMGRANLLQSSQCNHFNLLAHLQRMHPIEYKQYLSLKESNMHFVNNQSASSSQTALDIQQSVVSTIKSEDLEFVEVGNDEMNDDLAGETGDSFESSDYYENHDNFQTHNETAATSTTKTTMCRPNNEFLDSSAFNENMYAEDSSDEQNDRSETKNRRLPLIFRGGFFRYIRKDGVSLRAECLNCQNGNVYCGHMGSTSNFTKHLVRMHPKEYERYSALKEEEKAQNYRDRSDHLAEKSSKFEQNDFNRIVLNFMINGMHEPSLLEDPTFATLLNEMASNRSCADLAMNKYHIISVQILNAEIDERISAKMEALTLSMTAASSVSTAIDIWSAQHKTFLCIVANWIDTNNFQRISSMIACDIFAESISNDILLERVHQVYTERGISNKVVSTVTNNYLTQGRDEAHEKTKHIVRPIDGLANHIINPTYLFEVIGNESIEKALTNYQFAQLHKSTFMKFNDLYLRTKSMDPSVSATILNEIFHYVSVGSKTTEIYNNVLNLVNCDTAHLNETLAQLGLPLFDDTELSFLREFSIVLEPIATAIEYLQKNNCYYATVLPMVYSMKENLTDIMNREEIHLCKALLMAILWGVEHHFEHLFDFESDKCIPAIIATCTHPFFKMRWLKGTLKTPANTNQILDLLTTTAANVDDGTEKKLTCQQPSTSNDVNPTSKKFKFSFDTSSNEETNDETMIQMDFMSFLKKPCQNNENHLQELTLHPWVQKLFVKYNSMLPSVAALERSVPLSDLIRKSQTKRLSDEMFNKLGLLLSY